MNEASQKNKFLPVYFNGQRVDGYWKRNGVYYLRANGSRTRQEHVASDKEAKEDAAKRALQAPEERKLVNPNATVTEFWEVYEGDEMKRLAPRTQDKYRTDWELRIKPAIGEVRVRQVNRAHILQILADMRDSTYTKGKVTAKFSPAAVYHLQTTLGSLMQAAVDHEYRTDNPVRGLPKKKKAHLPEAEVVGWDKVYTPQEISDVVDKAEDERAKMMFLLAADTGMRNSELCGLKRECIDFEHGLIHIKWQLADKDAAKVVPLKWAKEIPDKARIVYPRPETMTALREYLKTRQVISPWVFPTSRGNATAPAQVLRWLHEAKKEAGITRKLDMHCFRHTYVSYLGAEGLSSADIAQLIGDSTAVVESTYRHFIDGEKLGARVREALGRRHLALAV